MEISPKRIVIASLGIALVLAIAFFILDIGNINRDREGCERLNTNRQVQFEYLRGDMKARAETIQEDKKNLSLLNSDNPVERIYKKYGFTIKKETIQASIAAAKARLEINQKLLRNDTRSLQDLVKSADKYAPKNGSVIVDCSTAYPYPWPAVYLD